MPQSMYGKASRIGFLFQHKQHRIAATVRPLYPQRHVQLPKALTQTLLELFLAQRGDGYRLIQAFGLMRRKKCLGVMGVIENQVLEILIVADGVCHGCSSHLTGYPSSIDLKKKCANRMF